MTAGDACPSSQQRQAGRWESVVPVSDTWRICAWELSVPMNTPAEGRSPRSKLQADRQRQHSNNHKQEAASQSTVYVGPR